MHSFVIILLLRCPSPHTPLFLVTHRYLLLLLHVHTLYPRNSRARDVLDTFILVYIHAFALSDCCAHALWGTFVV